MNAPLYLLRELRVLRVSWISSRGQRRAFNSVTSVYSVSPLYLFRSSSFITHYITPSQYPFSLFFNQLFWQVKLHLNCIFKLHFSSAEAFNSHGDGITHCKTSCKFTKRNKYKLPLWPGMRLKGLISVSGTKQLQSAY